MQSAGRMFAMAVMAGVGIAIGLMGCDRSLSLHDPISPTADMKVTQINLSTGEILTPSIGTSSGSTNTTNIDFPQVQFHLTIFNGISVKLTDFRVDYYTEDGVTTLGLPVFGGFLTRLLDGGTLTESSMDSISPGVKPVTTGAPGGGDVQIAVVSSELRSYLAGPDGKFRTSSTDKTTTDDFLGYVVAIVRFRGVDINNNDVEAVAKISISAIIPLASSAQ